jgi:hypothetical protein
MKALLLAVFLCAFVVAPSLGQQQSPIYDHSYYGPTNYYGQPAYQPVPKQQQPRNQPPPPGIIPQALTQAQQAGGYLWSFLPAPWRGGPQPSYIPPANPENLVITLVPGAPQ